MDDCIQIMFSVASKEKHMIYDLCNDCFNEFKKWLEDKTSDKNKPKDSPQQPKKGFKSDG